jgi:hypothetical protein
MSRLALLALFLSSCALPGDRANGGCPSGEICSPATPNGLFFLGSTLGDEVLGRAGPLTTATGGTQTITAVTGAGNGSPPFTMPFNTTVTNSALSIDSTSPPNVVVRGGGLGSAYLRLVDPSNNELFDRVLIEVADVATADVRPADYVNPSADEQFATDASQPWSLWNDPAGEPLVARLFAQDSSRVADESMQLSMSASTAITYAHTSWDVLAPSGPLPGSSVTVHVGSGGHFAADLPVALVSTIDDIVWVNAVGAEANVVNAIHLATPTTFCFRAVSGGHLLAGVTWSFGGATVVLRTLYAGKNCVTVQSATAQQDTLTVNASGLQKQFTLTFSNARWRTSDEAPRSLLPPEAAPGDRAAGLD